jgi:MFS family permease
VDASLGATSSLTSGQRIAPYAWFIMLQACVTSGVVFGIWFSFAVFFHAMVQEFHWSRGGAAAAFSVGSMVQALLAPVCGMLIDRCGPRRVVVSGLLSMAVGLAACRMVQELWHLTVLFGVLVGLGVGLAGQVTHAALLSVWFIKRRGTIIGFAFAGMGLGVQAISPLAQHLILRTGWRQTFVVLALGTAVYAVLVFLTLRNRPQDVGLQPYGTVPRQTGAAAPRAASPLRTPVQPWTVQQALRTREFWALSVAQFLIPTAIFPIAVHQVAYLADLGFSAQLAAAILGTMGLMSSFGRLIFGVLSDRLGRFGGVTLSVVCSQLGILVLVLITSSVVTWPLYLYACFFGLGYGARGPILSAIAADLFPGPSFGTIFGLISIGYGLGGALGPWFGGYAYDLLGSYRPAFMLALGALFGVIACFWMATRRLAIPRH